MLPWASQAGPSMPLVKEFSAVSGRAMNNDSSAACADFSIQAPGNSKAARGVNVFKRWFKILIRSKSYLCSRGLHEFHELTRIQTQIPKLACQVVQVVP